MMHFRLCCSRKMPRKYIKLRQSKPYSEEDIVLAALNVIEQRCSLREAATRYKIPLGTLHNKIKEKHKKNVGRPTILSEAEEEKLVTLLNTCGDWGFPLSTYYDLRAPSTSGIGFLSYRKKNKKSHLIELD